MATDIRGRPVNHQMIKPHKYGGTPQEQELRRKGRLALAMALEAPLVAQEPHWLIEDGPGDHTVRIPL